MSNLSLYNITNKFVDLMDKASEGELTEEEYNELGQELAIQLQQKGSNIIGYTKNIELTINAMKEEEKRISENRKSLENKLERFKQYVKENMERLGITKMDTELGTLSIQNSPKATVEITDEDKIPDKYKNIVQEIKIDKTAIAKDVKETGNAIPGTNVIINTYLRIR